MIKPHNSLQWFWWLFTVYRR